MVCGCGLVLRRRIPAGGNSDRYGRSIPQIAALEGDVGMKPWRARTSSRRIVDAKRQRLERTRMRVPEAVVKHFALQSAALLLRFVTRCRIPGRFAFLPEVKKASPSRGVFRQSFSVSDLVDSYTSAGASAISVVTEEDFFQGTSAGSLRFESDPRSRCCARISCSILTRSMKLGTAKASAILLIVAMLKAGGASVVHFPGEGSGAGRARRSSR